MVGAAPGGFTPRVKKQTLKQRLKELPTALRDTIRIWTREEIRHRWPDGRYTEEENQQAKRPAGVVRQL